MALDSQFGGHPVQGVQDSPPPPYSLASTPGWLALDVNDLLTVTDTTKPLYEFEVGDSGLVFNGSDHITAGVAATASSALRLFKNGAANGTITFTGSSGLAAFTSGTYAAGDLFGLYPPVTLDATLDRLRITLGTD
jgi:hypothetical protein